MPESLNLLIPEARKGARRYDRLVRFTSSSTKAAGVMLLAAIAALVIANTGIHEPFLRFWDTEVGFLIGDTVRSLSLAEVINDLLMAVFFLLVGLEVKYELTVGELTNIRQALLPIMGAVGGVALPALIYVAFNAAHPESAGGWGVPTATDIAFALGILALLGNRVPSGVRVFLSTLAVADDIIAILIIALFYGHAPNVRWLVAAAVVYAALVVMNRRHAYSLVPYVLMGLVLWYCVFRSGIHSTIAGVLLAFVIPSGSHVNLKTFSVWVDDKATEAREVLDLDSPVITQGDYLHKVAAMSRLSRKAIPPAVRLEHKLYPWVYFAILPLFALTNADVSLGGMDLGTVVAHPVFFGVALGLLLGKPLGILGLSALIVKLKFARLPENVNWGHMAGASVLGGVGFTMAIFVSNLAYDQAELVSIAKLGILTASFLAGVIGFALLSRQAKAAQKRGEVFAPAVDEQLGDDADSALLTADREARREAERMMRELAEKSSAPDAPDAPGTDDVRNA